MRIDSFGAPRSFLTFGDICIGPDGNAWFTQPPFSRIVRMNSVGAYTSFDIPSAPAHGIAMGPNGYVWFTSPYSNLIGRIDVERANSLGTLDSSVLTEFQLPTGQPGHESNLPAQIAAGPDGNMWFTELGAGKIGRISPNGTITEYPVPGEVLPLSALTSYSVRASNPYSICGGPDGHLWFTMPWRDRLGRVSTNGQFHIPNPSRDPIGGLPLPYGSTPAVIVPNLWFSETTANKVGRVVVQASSTPGQFSFHVEELTLPAGAIRPFAMAIGSKVWFSVQGRIGYIDPSRRVTMVDIPPWWDASMGSSHAFGYCGSMVAHYDGTLWFTDQDRYRIGRIDLEEPTLPDPI